MWQLFLVFLLVLINLEEKSSSVATRYHSLALRQGYKISSNFLHLFRVLFKPGLHNPLFEQPCRVDPGVVQLPGGQVHSARARCSPDRCSSQSLMLGLCQRSWHPSPISMVRSMTFLMYLSLISKSFCSQEISLILSGKASDSQLSKLPRTFQSDWVSS